MSIRWDKIKCAVLGHKLTMQPVDGCIVCQRCNKTVRVGVYTGVHQQQMDGYHARMNAKIEAQRKGQRT